MDKRRPAVVVLAAGRGHRFAGTGHKLTQSLGDSTVIERVLGTAIGMQSRVVVVTSVDLADVVTQHIAARDVVLLPEAQSPSGESANGPGMGDSIAAGVAATGDADGWLILPADMPLVRLSSLHAVADALLHHPIAYAQHRGRQGHPVGFGTELYSELTALRGDLGARRLLARYPAQAVELDDPGVLLDIDTLDDLTRVRALLSEQVPAAESGHSEFETLPVAARTISAA
ncbi:NTP transferase domain-containing protein [Roseateles sp. BYS180W]|uniref:NTP transferase domain-containing protein n=1 Tax=Roseateles rivi TaxID=3299028 RepID=A0ABW7FZT7_9BURK